MNKASEETFIKDTLRDVPKKYERPNTFYPILITEEGEKSFIEWILTRKNSISAKDCPLLLCGSKALSILREYKYTTIHVINVGSYQFLMSFYDIKLNTDTIRIPIINYSSFLKQDENEDSKSAVILIFAEDLTNPFVG